MQQNETENTSLTAKQERAAELLAEDDLTDEQIAAEVGVSRPTLHRWKQRPEFAARQQHYQQVFAERVMAVGIARREKRVQALNRRWEKMHALIEARGVLLADEIRGGETGLLTRTVKVIGTGQNQQVIEEYAFDAALLRELREHEKQTAQELGQWTEKSEQHGEQIIRVVYADDDADAP